MWGSWTILNHLRVATTLARVSRRDLHKAMSMVDSAQASWAGLSAPSPLATALLLACTTALGIEADSPSFGIAAVATLFGYSARLARPAAALPPDTELTIGTQLVGVRHNDNGDLDPSELGPLLTVAATLADDSDRVRRLADVDQTVWSAFSALAATQVRERASRNGVPAPLIPTDGALERLLRFGYVLRLIDEVADARLLRP